MQVTAWTNGGGGTAFVLAGKTEKATFLNHGQP